ncbi:MAG: glyoxalase [Chloroflexi bacterium]|nr:MAG: glyoxalase [Chloroflexota bacterium]
MKTQSIAAKTGMGAVDLAVTDGETALRFYRDYVGLKPLPSEGNEIRMGAGNRELVVLHPGAERAVAPKTSGLYHLAIVLPDRRELARVIARLGRLRWDQYPTDHVMTKANYLWDPDGNGLEIYVESPEDGTMGMVNGTYGAWDKDGRPRSGRDPIDLEEMFSHLRPDDRLEEPMPAGTKMGHVHLHVADVDEALRFYVDLVGFDVMGQMPGVGFISAGGYHHHLGLNEWAGHGARPAPAGAAGLRRFTIELPTQRDLDDVVNRLEHVENRLSEEADGFATLDPSANHVLFRVAREPSP